MIPEEILKTESRLNWKAGTINNIIAFEGLIRRCKVLISMESISENDLRLIYSTIDNLKEIKETAKIIKDGSHNQGKSLTSIIMENNLNEDDLSKAKEKVLNDIENLRKLSPPLQSSDIATKADIKKLEKLIKNIAYNRIEEEAKDKSNEKKQDYTV